MTSDLFLNLIEIRLEIISPNGQSHGRTLDNIRNDLISFTNQTNEKNPDVKQTHWPIGDEGHLNGQIGGLCFLIQNKPAQIGKLKVNLLHPEYQIQSRVLRFHIVHLHIF